MSVIQRILAPGVEVSAHFSEPGRAGVNQANVPVRVEGTMFATSARDALNVGDIVLVAMHPGLVTHLALWIDQVVEGSCMVFQPTPVVEGQEMIIPAGRLRLRFA